MSAFIFNSFFSYYNIEEAKTVVGIIEKLLAGEWNGRKLTQSDIGIVSPYAEQCRRIGDQCNSKGLAVVIGSAEVFQGQERPVIIISTVRTGLAIENLGFVANDRV